MGRHPSLCSTFGEWKLVRLESMLIVIDPLVPSTITLVVLQNIPTSLEEDIGPSHHSLEIHIVCQQISSGKEPCHLILRTFSSYSSLTLRYFIQLHMTLNQILVVLIASEKGPLNPPRHHERFID